MIGRPPEMLDGLTRTSRCAEAWQMRVRVLMREGFGYDDIAVILDCRARDVRAEARILEAEQRLDALYLGREL